MKTGPLLDENRSSAITRLKIDKYPSPGLIYLHQSDLYFKLRVVKAGKIWETVSIHWDFFNSGSGTQYISESSLLWIDYTTTFFCSNSKQICTAQTLTYLPMLTRLCVHRSAVRWPKFRVTAGIPFQHTRIYSSATRHHSRPGPGIFGSDPKRKWTPLLAGSYYVMPGGLFEWWYMQRYDVPRDLWVYHSRTEYARPRPMRYRNCRRSPNRCA